jgi:outer membrane receptor protein involved in Fe transport
MRKMTGLRRWVGALLVGVGGAVCSGGTPAFAEGTEQIQKSADDNDIREIVVTARRKEESAQTVPVSVDVLDARTLAQ